MPGSGSVKVQTPAGGLVGSLTLIENNGAQGEGRACLPLQSQAMFSAVIPYQGHCTIETLNTNAFTIYVNGSVYSTAGEERYNTSQSLAAGQKQQSDWFSSWNPGAADAGHVLLTCSSPFYACATEYGSVSADPWIEARPAFPLDGKGIDFTVYRPLVDVQPGGLAFGTPTLGGLTHRPMQIANRGAAELNVTSISVDNPLFTVDAGSLPFTLASGDVRDGIVTYQVASTFAQTGTISIAHNDSRQGTVRIPLSADAADFTVVSAMSSNSALSLSWPAAATNGRLQFSSNLLGSTWLDIPRAPEVSGGRCVILTNPPAAKGYYRIIAR